MPFGNSRQDPARCVKSRKKRSTLTPRHLFIVENKCKLCRRPLESVIAKEGCVLRRGGWAYRGAAGCRVWSSSCCSSTSGPDVARQGCTPAEGRHQAQQMFETGGEDAAAGGQGKSVAGCRSARCRGLVIVALDGRHPSECRPTTPDSDSAQLAAGRLMARRGASSCTGTCRARQCATTQSAAGSRPAVSTRASLQRVRCGWRVFSTDVHVFACVRVSRMFRQQFTKLDAFGVQDCGLTGDSCGQPLFSHKPTYWFKSESLLVFLLLVSRLSMLCSVNRVQEDQASARRSRCDALAK